MHDFHHVPPRAARGFERIFFLTGIALLDAAIVMNLALLHQPSLDAFRVQIIAANLGLLCFVCSFAVRLYSARIRQLDSGPLSLNSLQSLIGVIVLVAAPPICTIVLALIISPASDAFQIVFPTSIIGAVVLLVAYFSMYSRRQAVG